MAQRVPLSQSDAKAEHRFDRLMTEEGYLMDSDREPPQAFMTALLTEHFVLQGIRSTVTSESASRAALYLASLTGSLIALGFVSHDVLCRCNGAGSDSSTAALPGSHSPRSECAFDRIQRGRSHQQYPGGGRRSSGRRCECEHVARRGDRSGRAGRHCPVPRPLEIGHSAVQLGASRSQSLGAG